MTDHDLSTLLHAAAQEAPLPGGALVATSVRAGTRRRRASVAAVVTSVAALAAVGVVLTTTGDRPTSRAEVATDPSPSVAPTTEEPTTSAEPEPEPWTPPARGTRRDTAVFADVVGPAVEGTGVLSDVTSYPYGYGGIRSVHATLTDENGSVEVKVAVTTDDPTTRGSFSLDELPAECGDFDDPQDLEDESRIEACAALLPSEMRCQARLYEGWPCAQLPDEGGTVRWGREYTYTDERDQGEYSHTAVVHRASGLLVTVYVFNGPGEKQGVTRNAPPVSLDVVREIALDPRWADVDLKG